MTEKRKLKNDSTGQIRYSWNLLLFARQFEAEVSAPPQIIAEQLTGIKQKMLRHSDKYYHRTAIIKAVREGELYTFNLQMVQLKKGNLYTSIKATGCIVYSQEYNKTFVHGKIRLGWLYSSQLLSMLLLALFFIFILAFEKSGLFGSVLFHVGSLVMMIVFFYYLTKIQNDYDELTNQIQEKANMAQRLAIEKVSNQHDLYFTSSKESAESTSKK